MLCHPQRSSDLLKESLFDDDMSFNISNLALFLVYLFLQFPCTVGKQYKKPIYLVIFSSFSAYLPLYLIVYF